MAHDYFLAHVIRLLPPGPKTAHLRIDRLVYLHCKCRLDLDKYEVQGWIRDVACRSALMLEQTTKLCCGMQRIQASGRHALRVQNTAHSWRNLCKASCNCNPTYSCSLRTLEITMPSGTLAVIPNCLHCHLGLSDGMWRHSDCLD